MEEAVPPTREEKTIRWEALIASEEGRNLIADLFVAPYLYMQRDGRRRAIREAYLNFRREKEESEENPQPLPQYQTPEPSLKWTAEEHALSVHAYFRHIKVENPLAVDNLIGAGYDRMTKILEHPPNATDLDKLGFNMYQRNVTLKVLGSK
jgi:hypothetical protein